MIPSALYKSFLSSSKVEDFKKLIGEMPETSKTCLCYILYVSFFCEEKKQSFGVTMFRRDLTSFVQFLTRVEKESASNLMDANNLATVFGPTIVRNPEADKKGNFFARKKLFSFLLTLPSPTSPSPFFSSPSPSHFFFRHEILWSRRNGPSQSSY